MEFKETSRFEDRTIHLLIEQKNKIIKKQAQQLDSQTQQIQEAILIQNSAKENNELFKELQFRSQVKLQEFEQQMLDQ